MKLLVNYFYVRRYLIVSILVSLSLVALVYKTRAQWSSSKDDNAVSLAVSIERLTKLFIILQNNEAVYQEQFDYLNVPSFFKVIESKHYYWFYQRYQYELELFTIEKNDFILPNNMMVRSLIEKSNYNSFVKPQRHLPILEVPSVMPAFEQQPESPANLILLYYYFLGSKNAHSDRGQ